MSRAFEDLRHAPRNHEPTGLVPEVRTWKPLEHTWTLPASPSLRVVGQGADGTARYLIHELERRGYAPVRAGAPSPADIVLSCGQRAVGPLPAPPHVRDEAYRLALDGQAVLTASTHRGLARAVATLLQLLDVHDGQIPRGEVVDWPDYPVRGFVLDVGRRFVPTCMVEDLIGHLAQSKLNTLVLHLNDNEITKDTGRGWDQAQSAFRLRSDSPHYAAFAAYDGAYTRQDWARLEDYAAQRGVTIVPEIDGPAHARAFIARRPELGLNGGNSDMFDLSTPDAAEFMKELLDHFTPWFEGPWLHFGADEYDRTHADDYRRYFNDIAAFIRSRGKQPAAWGSLSAMSGGAGLEAPAGYDRDVLICSWNNEWYGPEAALSDGYTIINTNDEWLYTVPYADYYCGTGLRLEQLWEHWEPHVFGSGVQIDRFNPRLLGAMSACWNDLVLRDYADQDIHDMVTPSFGLLGQKMWGGTPAGMPYAEFTERVRRLVEPCSRPTGG